MAKRIRAAAPRMNAEEKRYRARDDLRTLQAAHEIKHDKRRCDEACREAQRQIQALASVKPSVRKANGR